MRSRYRRFSSLVNRVPPPDSFGGSNPGQVDKFHRALDTANVMELPSIVGRIYAASPFKLEDRPENYAEGKGIVERIYVPASVDAQNEMTKNDGQNIGAGVAGKSSFADKLNNWIVTGNFK